MDKYAVIIAIKVMAVENGVVDVVGLDDVVAATTTAKNSVVRILITVPTSRVSTYPSQCTR